jgi:hypothetical protein
MKASTAHLASIAFASLLLAFIVSAGLGIFALSVMPCSWFGSSFEGACGYGAGLVVLAAGTFLTLGLASLFVFLYLRRTNSIDVQNEQCTISRSPHLLRAWRLALWSIWGFVALNFLPFDLPFQLGCYASWLIFCALTPFVADRAKERRLPWTLASLLIGPIGATLSYWYLKKRLLD